ncbi:2Fe-2S iron-sulfur cluster-binding protein [Spiribacter vilamensis]|uniref:2Fe-2S iron-sulfur cluster protein n=1 Tax=Spiribacter vilamensis TaxID=531306 RepID=A0A4Q8D1T7_9GAMM|nr:2Fe-2S iron-sulfur cluster-binding protein [Spiribacter vilamensis]RZU99346.1 2Fe-2S iron-sulfur cluster protein [Spiribacter vilamensis]
MTEPRFRPLLEPADWIGVRLNGEPLEVPRGMSVLAGLLIRADDASSPGWFCAIGQCQRCRVRINGREAVACQTSPAEGDVIETRDSWSG